jgi:hypothetical protein
MHVISINGSNAQKSKLRNGHKVRVKHGSGFNVIVNPSTYHVVSRAFLKNKGVTMQLSPEELAMNRAPSPELQAQIMGSHQPLAIPSVRDHLGGRGLGTGVGDWFKNLGNTIKSGFEDKIINPIKENIVNPVTDLYNKNVPESIRRDINTGLKFSSPVGLIASTADRLRKGEKIQDIMRDYGDDLKHLNDTKNKVIKSSPVLTDAYKKGVLATAGLGSAALGSAFGLSPATGALATAAGTMGANELLKAEGYGLHHHHHSLHHHHIHHPHHHHPHHHHHPSNHHHHLLHHALELGEHHHHHELKKHSKPIGGALKWSHITNFFKNAGHAIQKAVPAVKQGAQMAHNFLLNNPKLAAKVKEHGSKLAGMLAKMGVNYITGNEKYGDQAEQMGTKLADEQIHQNLGYGLYAGRQMRGNGYGQTPNSNLGRLGGGLYGGTVRHYGQMQPPSRLIGGGFNSYDTLHQATIDNAKANHMLGTLQNMVIQNQHLADPIKKYWDEVGAPPSRGSGLHKNHHGKVHHMRKAGYEKHNPYNLVRGKGTLLEHKSMLPPALQSQPYGSNFHMQNMLPPQYQKYNDGTNEY